MFAWYRPVGGDCRCLYSLILHSLVELSFILPTSLTYKLYRVLRDPKNKLLLETTITEKLYYSCNQCDLRKTIIVIPVKLPLRIPIVPYVST